MRRIGHARQFDHEAARSGLLARLADSGCPVCRTVDQAAGRFLFWFVNESHQQPEMLDQLRSSLGMCAPHTRDLLRVGVVSVAGSVLREVLPAAGRRLGQPRSSGPCPACASLDRAAGYQLSAIIQLLDDQAVIDAYRAAGGMCVAHVLLVLPAVPTRRARLLVSVLRDSLACAWDGGSLAGVGGSDPDAPARQLLRELLPCEPAQSPAAPPGRASLERLDQLLEVDACPACLAGGRTERRYLRWLAAGVDGQPADGSRGIAGHDDLELCRAHLHDLAELAPAAGAVAARRQAERWLGMLEGCDRRLEREARLGSLAGRRAAARETWELLGGADQRRVWTTRARSAAGAFLQSRRGAREEALAGLREPWCRACHAIAQDQARATGLLLAALRDEPTGRRYQSAHGLCARHALELPDDGRVAPVRAGLLARLEVLGWELAEADRMQGWALRYRPSGPEASAWLRASALVDGAVFLGGPATSLPPARWDRRDRDRSPGPPPVPVRGPAPLKYAGPSR